jgi:uncharacterized membrane protein
MQDCAPMNLARAERPAASPQFTATLVPGYFLPPSGFLALLVNIAAAILLSISVFIFLSALWLPVLWCLDAALCYGVYFRMYAPRRMSENVELTEEKLSVTRTGASGKTESWDFNPYWVRFEHRKHRREADELWLSSGGLKLALGAFLSDSEKATFAVALSKALAVQRNQPGQKA